jgi:aquaporin Z
MSLKHRIGAEFVGTFWLVLGGCGSAVLAAGFPGTGIGFLGVSLAFGLTVLTMAYAIGHVSGCHLNPAVTLGLAANGYGAHSPGGYSLTSALVTEIVMTFMFLFIILGATDARAPHGFAPLAIGLGLTLIHLISIPVTNTSVNPARSTGPALIVGGWALTQLWLFWVAPLLGAAIAGVMYRIVTGEERTARSDLLRADVLVEEVLVT